MVPLKYIRVSDEVLDALESSLLQGDLSVLVGPRFAGKRTALRSLQTRLEHQNATTIMVDLLTPPVPASEKELTDRLLKALPKSVVPEETCGSVQKALEYFSGQMILFLSNIDAMPQQISEVLLQSLEQRAELGKIVALLTGETDLRQLVGGTRRGFNVAHHFFVQGLDEKHFRHQVDRYSKQRYRLSFEEPEQCHKLLYQATGGNAQLVRSLLEMLPLRNEDGWHANEPRVDSEALVVTPAQIKQAAERPPDSAQRIFRNATRHLWQDPACCAQLEQLLEHPRGFELPDVTVEPGTLELAGVAVREFGEWDVNVAGQAGYLKFSSPLFESFIRSQYDEVSRGDLYAQSGDWETAAERYSRAPREQRIRPRSSDDRVLVDLVVRSLCFSLHLRATEESETVPAVDRVESLFMIGCRWLLGFEEISWFRRQANLSGQMEWVERKSELDRERTDAMLDALKDGVAEAGEIEVPPLLGDAIGVALREQSTNELTVVLLSDTKYGTRISPVRRAMVDRVIDNFVRARDHAVAVDAKSRRLEVLHRYREIYNGIYETLGARRLPIDDVLDFVAEKVMPLGYRVFGCAHYDRVNQQMICGIYREHDQVSRVWPNAEIEQANLTVAQTQKPAVVADSKNRDLLILPILFRQISPLPEGGEVAQVTHTVCVQRKDFEPLTFEERADLTAFGEQLMMAVRHGERITLVEATLDLIKEPVAIVDPAFRVRYANLSMRDLFPESPDGWEETQHARPAESILKGAKADRLLDMFAVALRGEDEGGLTEQINVDDHDEGASDENERALGLGLGTNEGYYGRIHVGHIENSRRRPIGAVAHVRDFRDQLTIFRSISLFFAAQSEEVLHSLLLQYARPQKAWRRLYRLDPNNRDRLIGAGAVGSELPELEREFSSGKVTIERSRETDSAFICFDRRAPVLFQAWAKPGQYTKYGVPIEALPNPPWVGLLKKTNSSMWLDVPFGGDGMGKLSMACDEQIRPEEIEYWRILGDAAGLALKNLRRQAEGQNTAALAAERVFLASVAHNLHTRISSLYTVQARYAILARQSPTPKLLEINEMFNRFLGNLQSVMDRVKQQLGAIEVTRSEFDVVALLRETFEQRDLHVSVAIESTGEHRIHADRSYLSDVVAEIIQNSADAASDPKSVQMRVKVEEYLAGSTPWTRIEISDNGRGVHIELKSRIFELFFTHRTNGTVGTGIGLYFCRRVIHAHGGTIVEEGTPGEGARFVIEIPYDARERRS